VFSLYGSDGTLGVVDRDFTILCSAFPGAL